ncbi:pyrimidine utilization protein D [Marinomonas sp. THO17]|uniref:pyrimidine utilization protein D n=1 Tax=Marinomonas sp. THO17 TaxID=3149048 RepID=UPI00336C1B32
MYYELHGLEQVDAPTLVFSSGLGGSANFWQSQLPELTERFRILIYDQAGTGRSPAKLSSDYSIKTMTDELLTLLEELNIQKCHLIGHALGGLVALQMADQAPEKLQSMVLINAWSSPNPHTLRCFNIRKAILANCAPDIYLQMQALILYPPDWIANNIKALEEEEAHLKAHFPDRDNLLARISALSEFDIESRLANITTPSLVVANKDDLLVPWQRSQVLSDALPNAQLRLMDYGGHASTITAKDHFNTLLIDFLDAQN